MKRRELQEQREAQREAGELFFVRMSREEGDDLDIEMGFEDRVRELLPSIRRLRNSGDVYFFIEVALEPGAKTLKELRALPGVTRVSVY